MFFLFAGEEGHLYLFEVDMTVEVWVGREMGDGVVEEEEEGKGVRGKDGIRSLFLFLSLSLSLCYAMICSIVDFCTM